MKQLFLLILFFSQFSLAKSKIEGLWLNDSFFIEIREDSFNFPNGNKFGSFVGGEIWKILHSHPNNYSNYYIQAKALKSKNFEVACERTQLNSPPPIKAGCTLWFNTKLVRSVKNYLLIEIPFKEMDKILSQIKKPLNSDFIKIEYKETNFSQHPIFKIEIDWRNKKISVLLDKKQIIQEL